jgi:hypothetical protein
MPRTKLIAFILAAATATGTYSAPACAGGSIAIDIPPGSAKSERAMRAGLGIYSIVNNIQNGASIKQLGTGNMGGIAQNGSGNQGIVHQEGSGHSGTLQQTGNGNAYGLFQFGKGTNADIVQNGNGQTGTTIVYGW